MAEGSLSPAFVVFDYHSEYAPHKMIVPTLPWNPGAGGGDFDTWAAGSTPAAAACENWVDLLKPFFTGGTTFDGYTIYTQPTPDDLPLPRYSAALAVAGTSISAATHKATQATFSAKCTDGSLAKVVLMDVANDGNFNRITYAGLTGAAAAFVANWFDSGQPWSSRLNGQPYYFVQISYTLNEKLRKQYHMQ